MRQLLFSSMFLLVLFSCCGVTFAEKATSTVRANCVDVGPNATEEEKKCCTALDAIIQDWCRTNLGKGTCSKCLDSCKHNTTCKGDRSGDDLTYYCTEICMWNWCGDGPDPEYKCPKKNTEIVGAQGLQSQTQTSY